MQLIIRTYNHQHLEKCLLKPKKHASSSYGNGTLDKIVIEILLKSNSLKSKSFVVHTSVQKRIGIGLTFDWQKKLGLYQIPSLAGIRPFVQIRLRPKFGRISGFQPRYAKCHAEWQNALCLLLISRNNVSLFTRSRGLPQKR